jgi:hypothetical protein
VAVILAQLLISTFVANNIFNMEKKISYKEAALVLIEKVKADPEAFINYIESKNRGKELTLEEKQMQRKEIIARIKARKQNEKLSI